MPGGENPANHPPFSYEEGVYGEEIGLGDNDAGIGGISFLGRCRVKFGIGE